MSNSTFYQLYYAGEKNASELITAASFPSYITTDITGTQNGKPSSAPSITSPHNFSSLDTDTKYWRLKTGSKSITITNVANIKKVRFYGNGSSSQRSITTTVTKVSGEGTAFTVAQISGIPNSNTTIAEYSTVDFTSQTGYNASTYYTYNFTFSGDFSLWGIYVEAATAATTYSVTHSLTNVTATSGATGASAATSGTAYNAVFAASSGYTLPETIGVTIGGTAATSGTDYTWNSSTGAFQVPAAKVTGAIVVTIAGVAENSAYTVSFDAGSHGTYTGGDITEASVGAGITLPSLTTLATGYIFNGWYTASTGGTKAGDADDAYALSSDTELFAQYSAKTYTITLDDNGGTADGSATATYDSKTLTSVTAPTYSGHSIAGYYQEAACTNLIADASGNLQANTDYTDASGNWTNDGNVTLYAKWEEVHNATITWAFSLGTNTDANKTATTSIDYFKGSTVTIGSSLSYNGTTELKNDGNSLSPQEYSTQLKMGSNESSASNNNAVIFKITPKTGVTFTPTRVSFRATRCGTNGGKMTMKWLSAGSDAITLGTASATTSNTDPARDSNGTQNWTDYSYDLTAKGAVATTGEFGLSINLYNTEGKSYALGNIVIEGTYSGEPSSATYDITVSVADGQSTYGTFTPEGTAGVTTVDDGDDLTITAIPNTAYKFQKWLIDDATEITTNPYTFSNVSANHTAEAYFLARKTISYTGLTTEIRGTVTNNLGTEYANDADKFTAPVNKYLSDAGKTLTAWKDANETNYTPGTEYTLTGDIALTPVFTANAEGSLATIFGMNNGDVTVTWQFGKDNADFNMQGNTGYYTQQATINGNTVDVPMYINTTSGKVNNQNRNDAFAQTNGGTVFTVPVKNGAVIVMNSYSAFGRDGQTQTQINGSTEYTLTNNNKTATYTYSGNAETINITLGSDIQYTSSVSVTYPSATATAPVITPANGSYSYKGTEIVMTSTTEGARIYYTLDGTTPTDGSTLYNSSSKPTITGDVTIKAIAYHDDYLPSDVTTSAVKALENQTVLKDAAVWDMTELSKYNTKMVNAIDIDVLYANLAKYEYNITFPAAFNQTALMMNGQYISRKESNGTQHTMAQFMKFTTANPGKLTVEFASNSTNDRGVYVTVDGGEKNNGTNTSSAKETYVSNEYNIAAGDIVIGGYQVSDNSNTYVRIKKITFEPTTIQVTISANKYATFSSTQKLDFTNTGVKAYKATTNTNSSVHLEEVTVVPANTGVLLYADVAENTVFTIPVSTEDASNMEGNKLQSTANGAHDVTAEEYGKAYVFGKLNNEVGFYKAAEGKTVAQGRCYLLLDNADAPFLSMIFDDGATTNINLNDNDNLNGDTPRYNLSGQRVSDSYKGIVIVKGKKVVIK